MKAFQDYYAEEFSHCYGCGKSNADGLHVKSYWDGDETVCHYTPEPFHTGGFPRNVYGGLLAALMDCHGNGTAAAAKYKAEGREMGTEPNIRFVTAQLNISFLKPTPIGVELEIRAEITEVKERKVIMNLYVIAKGEVCVKGTMVAVQLPA